jgi:hypothetical protein
MVKKLTLSKKHLVSIFTICIGFVVAIGMLTPVHGAIKQTRTMTYEVGKKITKSNWKKFSKDKKGYENFIKDVNAWCEEAGDTASNAYKYIDEYSEYYSLGIDFGKGKAKYAVSGNKKIFFPAVIDIFIEKKKTNATIKIAGKTYKAKVVDMILSKDPTMKEKKNISVQFGVRFEFANKKIAYDAIIAISKCKKGQKITYKFKTPKLAKSKTHKDFGVKDAYKFKGKTYKFLSNRSYKVVETLK